MAETYHVLNWRELPLKTAAVLASGLHEDSRSLRKLTGQKLRSEQYTQLAILDELRLLRWMRTKDAAHGRNKPDSILDAMLQEEKKVTGFRTPEEFEARRQKIISGVT
jgi:hypothetical protein